jgi:glycosyl hydrolase family 26
MKTPHFSVAKSYQWLLRCSLPVLIAACGMDDPGVYELSEPEPTEAQAAGLATVVSLKPTSDVALSNIWGGGGTAPIYKLVDDGTSFASSDGGSTFARSAPGITTTSLTLGYAGAPAGGASEVAVNYQAWSINSGAGTVTVKLYNGNTLLGTAPAQTLSTSAKNLSHTFTGLSVEDANQLRTEVVFQNTAGQGSLIASIVWIDVTQPDPGQPVVSDKLVPKNGAWWGAYARASAAVNWNWDTALKNFEAKAGRKLDIVYRYHDWGSNDNGIFPDVYEKSQMTQGYIVHLSWESRQYSSGKNFTWTEIANGSQDAVINAAAQRAKASTAKFMISFDHEMDNTAVHSADGPDVDYVAAYRHIIDLFKAAGVTNVVWVWTPMGWSGTYSRLPNLYPGDSYIDWLGYDPYNFYTCNKGAWKTPATTFGSFYDWMHQPAQMAWHGAKPYILAEFSSHEDSADPNRKGDWMRDVVDAIKLYPDIKAVQFFDSTTSLSGGFCNLLVDSTSQAQAGYAEAGTDPYVNQPH